MSGDRGNEPRRDRQGQLKIEPGVFERSGGTWAF